MELSGEEKLVIDLSPTILRHTPSRERVHLPRDLLQIFGTTRSSAALHRLSRRYSQQTTPSIKDTLKKGAKIVEHDLRVDQSFIKVYVEHFCDEVATTH